MKNEDSTLSERIRGEREEEEEDDDDDDDDPTTDAIVYASTSPLIVQEKGGRSVERERGEKGDE